MINGLQILAIMPLVDCETPGNAQFLYMKIYMIASFNIIDVSVLTDKISYELDLKENKESISNLMHGFGFTTTSQINNLGIVFFFFMLAAFYLIMLLVLSCIRKVRCKKAYGIRK